MNPCRDKLRMQARLIKGRLRPVWRINHLGLPLRCEADQSMVNIVGLMMFTVHIQQHSWPNMPFSQSLVETVDPERLHQKEIQPRLGSMLLDTMDEEVIGVQFVRHHKIINSKHKKKLKAKG